MHQENALYIDTDPDTGHVWTATGYEVAKETDLLGFQFVDEIPEYSVVRIIAHPRNNNLIAETFERVSATDGQLELASPRFSSPETAASSDLTLLRARELRRASSLGGFHVAVAAEIPAYSGVDDDSHLVWRYLDFIPGLDRQSVMRVVRHIRDPRWFVDTRNPERLSPLRAWMGLQPTMVGVMLQGDRRIAKVRRLRDIYHCWMHAPESFVHQEAVATGVDEQKIVLRGSSIFLNYLVRTWQQSIVDQRRGAPQLFLPEMLLPANVLPEFNEWLSHRS